MARLSSLFDYHDNAFIFFNRGYVEDISDAFSELTEYTKEEILGFSTKEIIELLRINATMQDLEQNKPNESLYIFTKSYEAIETTILVKKLDDINHCIYIFTEKARVSDNLLFVEQLCHDNIRGVAVHSIPDLVLLKANQKYLDFQNPPFNHIENCIGKKFKERVKAFEGSKAEEVYHEIIRTGKSYYPNEYKIEYYQRGITYWNASLVPIIIGGTPKYIIDVGNEVTETVLNRRRLIESQRELESHKLLLESIVENEHDAIAVFNKDCEAIMLNAEARKLYPHFNTETTIKSFHKEFQFYDFNNNLISVENLPTRRAFNREKVRNEKILIKHPDWSQYTEINATLIFDDEDNLELVVVSHHNISDTIKNQEEIRNQQEQIINIEKERNYELVKNMEMKDEFLSLISHELRTPLTVITATLQTLELTCKNEMSDRTNRYLEKVKQNTNRLIKLINNLLDNTRVSSGHFKINKTNIDIIALNKKIIESILPFAEKKDIQLNLYTELASKVIGIDESLYERIILNLLSNAVKFTPGNEGKSIKVIISEIKKQEMIQIQVVDEGIGIPKDKMNLIFEKFGQVNNLFSRNQEGTGIGLSLVKMVVKQMSGEIMLDSNEGFGSTFTVILPAAKVDSVKENIIGQKTEERILQAAAIEFSDI
ncbi:MAG: HAMP domain-containing sensor histidine kinase [Eubacteriales bacterium]|nr:HAMP domain-containing sensor histidine kinase [Eubacteriales bacterium]